MGSRKICTVPVNPNKHFKFRIYVQFNTWEIQVWLPELTVISIFSTFELTGSTCTVAPACFQQGKLKPGTMLPRCLKQTMRMRTSLNRCLNDGKGPFTPRVNANAGCAQVYIYILFPMFNTGNVILMAMLTLAKIKTCSILSQDTLLLRWHWRLVWMGL